MFERRKIRRRFGWALVSLLAASCAAGPDEPDPTEDPAPKDAEDDVPEPAAVASSSAASAPAPEGMVAVPEGVFLMGGESPENTPVHEVIVARFFLDVAEVTMDAYAECAARGKCKPPRIDNPFCNALFADRGAHPVNCVDWNDAAAFCASIGKRLPTEREWEYAARGGAEQRAFSWGNDPPDRARACYMHEGGSCPVRSFEPGAFGLYDMTGNVWEWTSSSYGPYPGEAASGAFKVYRGGSWSRRFPKWMRGDLRNRYRPEEQSASLGFRCAADRPPLTCPPDTAPDATGGGTCKRTRGTPLCPAGEAFVAGGCRPGGIVPAWLGAPPGAGAPAPRPALSALAPPEPAATPVVGQSRSPSFDADCSANFPGAPVAYQFSGGGFHDREPAVRAAGCRKRDVGVTWTSACCPN